MANSWIEFAKKYAKENDMSYSETIRSKKAQSAYDKSKGTSAGKKGAVKTSGKGKDREIAFTTKRGGTRKTSRKAFEK